MTTYKLSDGVTDIELNEGETDGVGFQATSITGLGLSPVDAQFKDLGQGSSYRNTRRQPRDVDIALDIRGTDRSNLFDLLSTLARMLDKPLMLIANTGADGVWYLDVVRVSGGDIGTPALGITDVQLVITLRAGQPLWRTGDSPDVTTLATADFGTSVDLVNDGDAEALPIWYVLGPATKVTLTSEAGEVLEWEGDLDSLEYMFIYTSTGLVTGTSGIGYAQLSPAPRFWALPPGTSEVGVEVVGDTSATRVTCSVSPRRWAVI